MSGPTITIPSLMPTRSMGVKLIIVCVLALLMTIPALFVFGLIQDRSSRAADVVNEISSHVGGQQTFLGPTLLIPYTVPPQAIGQSATTGVYVVFPAGASAVVKTTTEERRRSLFKVPVFQAALNLDATFDLTGVPAAAPPNAVLDWSRAELVVGVTDPRGALSDATLTVDNHASTLVPARAWQTLSFGSDQNQHLRLTLLGTPAKAQPDTTFRVSANLHFSGAERIAVLAYGKTTQLSIQGDWHNPGFDGGFLPVDRTITPNGFSAKWTVPFIARGVPAEGPADSVSGLDATALGVSFVEVTDPYQSVTRSLKYVLLFLGLVFLTYFVFEVTTGRRVHPAQYGLVGIAQIIFYLLLLSISERIGFDLAFLLGGIATVALLSINANWVFASRLQGVRAAILFSLLYLLIYLLLRLEDNALLVGAFASFLAIAAAMYFTRRLDWYSPVPISTPPPPPPGNSA